MKKLYASDVRDSRGIPDKVNSMSEGLEAWAGVECLGESPWSMCDVHGDKGDGYIS